MRLRFHFAAALAAILCWPLAAEVVCPAPGATSDLSLRSHQARMSVESRLKAISQKSASSGIDAPVPPDSIPHNNIVDSEIFGRLVNLGIPSARLATDEEFFRRLYLDVTGYLPSGEETAKFLGDPAQDKRGRLIATLITSDLFVDRWTLWLGDLLENTSQSSNVTRQTNGRNAFHAYIREAIANRKGLDQIAKEVVSGTGSTYSYESGSVNYVVGGLTPMGPVQDTYDTLFAQNARRFLGMSQYDCIACHDGRRHLDLLSPYFTEAKRVDAQRMAAFFSRTRVQRYRAENTDPLYGSYAVTNLPRGEYMLNTDFGNRPARKPAGDSGDRLTPRWRNGEEPKSEDWRAEFGRLMTEDPMFAINLANRIWKHFFGMGLVEPVDQLDPARLDPDNPPKEPWTLQATHPRLLLMLADELRKSQYDLRAFTRLLVDSNAYQLSSRYDGEWKFEYVPLFARHYPRRLEGEEVHDAIAKATGVPASFRLRARSGPEPDPVRWALQLPEPTEPRSDRNALEFLTPFFRGDRDLEARSQENSILQRLALMNGNVVLSRTRAQTSPVIGALAKAPDNRQLITALWLQFLSRRPSAAEEKASLAHLEGRSGDARRAAVEDLAWAAINKIDFLYSY